MWSHHVDLERSAQCVVMAHRPWPWAGADLGRLQSQALLPAVVLLARWCRVCVVEKEN